MDCVPRLLSCLILGGGYIGRKCHVGVTQAKIYIFAKAYPAINWLGYVQMKNMDYLPVLKNNKMFLSNSSNFIGDLCGSMYHGPNAHVTYLNKVCNWILKLMTFIVYPKFVIIISPYLSSIISIMTYMLISKSIIECLTLI